MANRKRGAHYKKRLNPRSVKTFKPHPREGERREGDGAQLKDRHGEESRMKR